MMDFLKLAKERYSVRKFSQQPIEREKLERILAAGRVAPTACNRQPQRVLAVTRREGLEKLKKCTNSHFNATAALIVCYHREECWKRSFDGKPSGEIDASIVTTHMMLAAYELGIGSTWVMHFNPAALRAEYAIPAELEPVAVLVMGYPAEDAAPYPGHAQIRPEEETVRFEEF